MYLYLNDRGRGRFPPWRRPTGRTLGGRWPSHRLLPETEPGSCLSLTRRACPPPFQRVMPPALVAECGRRGAGPPPTAPGLSAAWKGREAASAQEAGPGPLRKVAVGGERRGSVRDAPGACRKGLRPETVTTVEKQAAASGKDWGTVLAAQVDLSSSSPGSGQGGAGEAPGAPGAAL